MSQLTMIKVGSRQRSSDWWQIRSAESPHPRAGTRYALLAAPTKQLSLTSTICRASISSLVSTANLVHPSAQTSLHPHMPALPSHQTTQTNARAAAQLQYQHLQAMQSYKRNSRSHPAVLVARTQVAQTSCVQVCKPQFWSCGATDRAYSLCMPLWQPHRELIVPLNWP